MSVRQGKADVSFQEFVLKPNLPSHPHNRSIWLGIAVGWLAQLGLTALLPLIVLVAIRYWSLSSDNPSLWLENPDDSSHPVWYALQASICVGSILAGSLAARLAPHRSLALPIGLVALSLIATAFEQFPRHLSTTVIIIWTGGPCVGLVIGVWLGRLFTRTDDALRPQAE